MSSINYRFPFRRSSRGAFATNNTTLDAVVDDLRILLLSNYGERPIHGDFGANLRSIVFDQEGDVLRKAEDLILAAIDKWMPFVTVTSITVSDSRTDTSVRSNEIRIKLIFEVGQIEGVLDQRIRN